MNLEALACGTPVVTYRTGGSPEAVDEKTGIVVDKGNIKQMAEAIMQICRHPMKLNPEDCRLRAVEHFNRDTQFDRYVELNNSLVQAK